MRSILLFGRGATPNESRVTVNGTASASSIFRPTYAAQETVVLNEPIILNPGDVLRHEQLQGNGVVTVDGSLLFGAPE